MFLEWLFGGVIIILQALLHHLRIYLKLINHFAWWKIKMLCIFKKFAYKIIVISLIKCVLFPLWKKEKSQLQLAYYSQALELVQIRWSLPVKFISFYTFLEHNIEESVS